MPKKTTEIVLNFMNVCNVLSEVQNGMTIGEIEKSIQWMTRGQVTNVLSIMEEMSFAYHEVKAHGRTGKKVYRLTEHAAINFAGIARQYTQHS